MGYNETEIIKYVMFADKEEFLQLPVCDPSVVFEDEHSRTEIRPVYLFWDKTDETLLQIYRRILCPEKKGLGALAGRTLSLAAVKHMQNKYKEVFLSHPETLFLSEKAEREVPCEFWYKKPDSRRDLNLKYALKSSLEILRTDGKDVTLFLLLPQECRYEEMYRWLLDAERAAGVRLSDLFLLGTPKQKECGEDVLDDFYEQTGLAGSFYMLNDCRKLMALAGDCSLLVDCFGLALKEIGRPAFYVDGAGVRTTKEIHRLEGVCETCASLRNHLDRAFLSAL